MQNKYKHILRIRCLLLALILLLMAGCGAQKDAEIPPAEDDEPPVVETEQTVTPEPEPEPAPEPAPEPEPEPEPNYTDLQEALDEPSADQNEADTQPVSPLDGIWVTKGFACGVSTIGEFIFSGNTYIRAAQGGGTCCDYETGMFTLENDVLKFSGKRHSISSGNYSTKDLQYDSPLTILSENEIQLKFGSYTRSDTITCAEDIRAKMEEKGAEFGYDAGESSAGSADYAYVAGSVFRDIRREYSQATAQCAYVYAYTDLNGDLCVLTDVRYKIISNYSEVTLHNMTKGTKITDPADYYEKQADRAYGSNKLQYLNLASEVSGHHFKMLSAMSSILNGGANTYGGVYVNADTLNQ